MTIEQIPLTVLKAGECAAVSGFSTEMSADCRKLLQHLGITRRTEITLIRRAPLGDPLQLELLGGQISLRASEAQYVYITRLTREAT